MQDIHIAGTGVWYPEDVITNDEIVASFNSYVDNFNSLNKESIASGAVNALDYSSVAVSYTHPEPTRQWQI